MVGATAAGAVAAGLVAGVGAVVVAGSVLPDELDKVARRAVHNRVCFIGYIPCV